MSEFTLQQQINTVVREIGMREYVYPTRVAAKKMKQDKADYELGAMKAVLATLVGWQAVDRGAMPHDLCMCNNCRRGFLVSQGDCPYCALVAGRRAEA